jgi:hypothetical protein
VSTRGSPVNQSQWFKFLPNPTFGGALNNYIVPVPVGAGIFNDSNLWDVRPNFGIWNGSVSPPRNIQLGLKLQF